MIGCTWKILLRIWRWVIAQGATECADCKVIQTVRPLDHCYSCWSRSQW